MTPDLLPERLRSKISVQPNGCWEWMGSTIKDGYGLVHIVRNGRKTSTTSHRVVYELLVGLIADGLVIDHLCRNRACQNPRHMEAVTQWQNVNRGLSARRSHCRHGHEFTPENMYTYGRGRRCRTCAIARMRVYDARRRLERQQVTA